MDYPIIKEKNFNGLLNAFKQADLIDRKLCIISDSNVAPLYLDRVKTLLEGHFSKVVSFIIEADENNKSLGAVSELYDFFIEEQFDRRSVIVALGGDAVCDIAGFAAATYMRGVPFVQIPTTLPAQIDNSKIRINHRGKRDRVGVIYQPSFVYINTATLSTLSKGELIKGLFTSIGYLISSLYTKRL